MRLHPYIVYNGAMTDTRSDIAAHKREVRGNALVRRAQLTPAEHAVASARIREHVLALPDLQSARQVFTFVSFGTEVDTHPLIDTLLASGYGISIPRIMDATNIQAVPLAGWDELEPGKWGILSPRLAEPAPGPFEVAIIPGVAFTVNGARIGHGRGYYDRWLETNHVGVSIALAFECQIVPELPVEPHDRPVDVIVTEQRVIEPRLSS